MRYDTPIYFRMETPGAYDENSGDYADDTVTEKQVWASVMDTGEETMRLVYGEIRQGSKTVHIQNHYTGIYNRIRIGDSIYAVDAVRRLRFKQTMILSEVQ